ncbi:hypothetical protein BN946_scf184817.g6 [Trametes cinnabarina]|uniref:DUF6589 domain-containing protein n=1 Tax=Pycnoporus cinnabarinus TaxID=5643 RepID=A0A060S5I8_PYCCI|nr:hypothetical protein BN946_scf184817.g6 [Trametes cinnabarina]
MWNRNVLYYLALDNAMRGGDIGLMEDLLPHLLFRFAGGGNHKYAVEILELLQGLHREWPDDVKDFVQQNCWLVNLTGKPNEFQAIDLVQEHTVKDVKVTYRPKGPNSSWALMKARAPAIPTLRAIDKYLEAQFRTLYRGTGHTEPSKEADVQLLERFYDEARVHQYQCGRDAADNVKEFVSDGVRIAQTTIIPKWLARREVYPRSSRQQWPSTGDMPSSAPPA